MTKRRYGLLRNEYTVRINGVESIPENTDEFEYYLAECENDPVFSISERLFRDVASLLNDIYVSLLASASRLLRKRPHERDGFS